MQKLALELEGCRLVRWRGRLVYCRGQVHFFLFLVVIISLVCVFLKSWKVVDFICVGVLCVIFCVVLWSMPYE